jgi:hypothetical protein
VDDLGRGVLIGCGFRIFERTLNAITAVTEADQDWERIRDAFAQCFRNWQSFPMPGLK